MLRNIYADEEINSAVETELNQNLNEEIVKAKGAPNKPIAKMREFFTIRNDAKG